MRTIHVVALGLFLLLIGFIVWLAEDSMSGPAFVTLIAVLLLGGLAGLIGAFAKNADAESQKMWIGVIGTVIGAIIGLLGGTAAGTQAGQAAAEDVVQEQSR